MSDEQHYYYERMDIEPIDVLKDAPLSAFNTLHQAFCWSEALVHLMRAPFRREHMREDVSEARDYLTRFLGSEEATDES